MAACGFRSRVDRRIRENIDRNPLIIEEKNNPMSILKNAIDSIQIAVEDYKSSDIRRNTSAVRNISAGILLLYKEKLCRLSPDGDKQLLILKDIRPMLKLDGSLGLKSFPGKNGKTETVNVAEIQKLFKSLGVKTNWDRFNKINRIRNDLEHFYSTEEPHTIRGLISDSFMLIHDFLTNELQEEPIHLIGEECWNVLLDITSVYQEEDRLCKESLKKADWKFETARLAALEKLQCPKCPSELIKLADDCGEYPEINLLCSSCGYDFQFSEILGQCIQDHLFADAYLSMTKGGEPPYEDCDNCGQSTFVLEGEYACMACCVKHTYKHCLTSGCDNLVEEHGSMDICDHCDYVESTMHID